MPNIHNLVDGVLATQEIGPVSSSSVKNGAGVDMAGWDGVLFLLNIGLIASSGVLDALVQSDDNSGFSSGVTVTGTAITQLADTDDDVLIAIDVSGYPMPEQFLRLVVTPATAAALLSAVAIRYRGRRAPVDLTGYQEVVRKTL